MSVATPHGTERMHVSPRSSNARGSAPCSAAPAFLRTPFQPFPFPARGYVTRL